MNVLTSGFLLFFALSTSNAKNIGTNEDGSLRGVAPEDLPKYKPNEDGLFQCFDGKKAILLNRINDDYCDCEDGSDEPGTSACKNSKFYCRNMGYKPAYINADQVNDGVCDEECCDGSDEWGTHANCENVCAKLGEISRKLEQEKRESELKGGLIKHYLKLKANDIYTTHKLDLDAKNKIHSELEPELAAQEAKADKLQSEEAAIKAKHEELTGKQKALLDKAMEAAVSLRRHNLKLKNTIYSRLTTLVDLFKDLTTNYNPDFNDKAVLSAIKLYKRALRNSFRIKSLVEFERPEEDDAAAIESMREIEEKDFQMCSLSFKSYKDLYDECKPDFDQLVSILADLEMDYNRNLHDLAVKAAATEFKSLMEKWSEEDSVLKNQEKTLADWHSVVDSYKKAIDGKSDDSGSHQYSDEENKLIDASKSASTALADIRRKVSDIDSEIKSIKSIIDTDLGPDNIFLAVRNDCTSFQAAEYTYEICFLGSASQKSDKDHSNIALGKFSEYGTIASSGEKAIDYSRLKFLNGQHCWNGPERSMHVSLECGAEPKILSVSEPEKCEYHMKMLSPVACPDLNEEDFKLAKKLYGSQVNEIIPTAELESGNKKVGQPTPEASKPDQEQPKETKKAQPNRDEL